MSKNKKNEKKAPSFTCEECGVEETRVETVTDGLYWPAAQCVVCEKQLCEKCLPLGRDTTCSKCENEFNDEQDDGEGNLFGEDHED